MIFLYSLNEIPLLVSTPFQSVFLTSYCGAGVPFWAFRDQQNVYACALWYGNVE